MDDDTGPPSRLDGSFGREQFSTGQAVNVVAGTYKGDGGWVAHQQRADLRPGSVWVLLRDAGLCLVPGMRLEVVEAELLPRGSDGTEPRRGGSSG